MKEVLLQRLAGLNEELDTLFTDLANYDAEALNKQPAPDSWCATQVLHHLLMAEKYSRQYCEKKLSFKPELRKAGFEAGIRAWLVSVYLKTPLKVKAPKTLDTSALPRESKLSDIIAEYKEQRELMEAFIQNVDESYLDKEVYKHALAGRLSLSGMFDFFEAHFAHHRKQLYRALAA